MFSSTHTERASYQKVKPKSSNWEVLSNHTFSLRPTKDPVSTPGTVQRVVEKPKISVPDVFITHAGHLVSEEQPKCDNPSQDNSSKVEDVASVGFNPCRENTLSSGGVTVIVKHDTHSDTLGRKRLNHKTVTNIFSSDIVRDKLRYENSDSQLIFNIEALKIAKRAHDLKELDKVQWRNNKKVRHRLFFNQLRKFRSLPNLSAIRNIAMKRSKSKLEMDKISSSDSKSDLKGYFGSFDIQAYYSAKTIRVLQFYRIQHKVRDIVNEQHLSLFPSNVFGC